MEIVNWELGVNLLMDNRNWWQAEVVIKWEDKEASTNNPVDKWDEEVVVISKEVTNPTITTKPNHVDSLQILVFNIFNLFRFLGFYG